jgi:hypothetical protein
MFFVYVGSRSARTPEYLIKEGEYVLEQPVFRVTLIEGWCLLLVALKRSLNGPACSRQADKRQPSLA